MKFWLKQEHRAAFEHAKHLTAYHSKSFFISARILPQERRWATYALYGFCRYADNLIDNPRQRTQTELLREIDRLSEEIQIAYRTGESEHPVLLPFITVAKRYGIPMEYPLDLLRGVQMDIQTTRYETFEDLYVFCYRVAGVVGLMMTHVLGYTERSAFHHAEKLGIAMQLTNILRDIQEDRNMGRLYLPLEELHKFEASEQDILDERMTPALRELVRFQVERADGYYQEANMGIPLLATESQFAIYSASKIYRGILRKIEERNYNPFLGRVFVPQTTKMRILLQEILRTKALMVQERFMPVQNMRL